MIRPINQSSLELPQEIKNLTQEVKRLNLTNASTSDKLTAKIDRLEKKLDASKQDETSKVLGIGGKLDASQKAIVGHVKIADSSYQSIDIYSSNSFSSPAIAKLQEGKSYGYLKKEDNWYLVQTSDGQEGYVNSRFVKETQQTP